MRHSQNIVDVYNVLVHNDKDIAGMVAYALYKRHKRNMILSHKQAHGGSEPNRNTINTWKSKTIENESRDTSLRIFADSSIKQFLENKCASCSQNRNQPTDPEKLTVKQILESLTPKHVIAIIALIFAIATTSFALGKTFNEIKSKSSIDTGHNSISNSNSQTNSPSQNK